MGWKSPAGWRRLGMIAVACIYACVQIPARPAGGPARPAGAPEPRAPIDALQPVGRSLFAFDFARARYQKAALSSGPVDSLGACLLLDSIQAGFPASDRWLALASPMRPFAPMRSAWGPSGDFFLLDRAGPRLELYDSNAQFLSGVPLPPEIRGRNLESFQIFWTRDGSFSFVDLGEGVVRQYAELRSYSDQGDWRLRNTIRLPVGTGACVWEPYARNPCCLSAQGPATCFDAYFNKVGPWTPSASRGAGVEPRPTRDGRDWSLQVNGGPACAAAPACFEPGKGFSACPPGPSSH
jgi:hypothetical protein